MTPQKTFIYGTFRWPAKGMVPLARIGQSYQPYQPDAAIEVLREFGATELRGKLYARPINNSSWTVVQMDFVRNSPWYKFYEQKSKMVLFDVEGSAPWEILYFRNESDETGTYVAVALRYLSETPVWVQGQRKREGFL
jgi:hypothetical protein